MNLDEISPEWAAFWVSGNNKEYKLRPFSIADELWLKRTFDQDLGSIFKSADIGIICRVIYHQIPEEQKESLRKQKIKMFDEDGVEGNLEVGGVDLLTRLLIGGHKEFEKAIQALLKTIGLSQPVQDKEKKTE